MTISLRRAFDKAVDAARKRLKLRGRLGRKNEDGGTSMAVADRPGFAYVTLIGAGSQTVDIARVSGVPRLPNLPVTLERIGGHLVVTGLDYEGGVLEAFLGDGIAAAPPHTHRTGSGLEYEMQAFWLDPGRVLWSGSGVTVTIRPLHYAYAGAEKYWPGGNLSLSAYLPSTADKWAWVVVGINPATNAAVAVTGAEYANLTDLTPARIADVNMLGYIVCGAVRCQEPDTALSSVSRYADARHWLGLEAFPASAFVDSSSGVADAGKPILLSSLGTINKNMLPPFQQFGVLLIDHYGAEIVHADLPITLIASGSADCNHGVWAWWFVIADPGGADVAGSAAQYIGPGDSAAISVTGDTLEIAVDAAGVVTLEGSLTVTHRVGIELRYVH